MEHKPISEGWWRITKVSGWVLTPEELDTLGPALVSFTGHGDRLRMFVLLAYVTCKPSRLSASFTWQGAWEFDQLSGTGHVKLQKDGRLKGVLKINHGDEGEFIAERSDPPHEPIQEPPSYQDKWRRRR
jgi:hypothetical protein